MVFFTCNACGTSLKKNKVDGHFSQCRSCTALSCMDCNKDFWGDEYKSHIKCVSEQERYGGKVTVNKGEKKQEQWIEQIQQAVSKGGLPPKVSGIIQRLLSFDNIPRKQAKLKNFLRTSVNVRDEGLAEQVWKALEACTKSENVNNGASDPKPNAEKKEVEEEKEQPKELSKREKKEERKRAHTKKEKKDAKVTEEEVKGEEPGKKKSKKQKHREQEEEQQDGNTTETKEDELNQSEVAENGEPRKKKKKEKKLLENNENNIETKENELNESEVIENGEPIKKKKEKKLKEQNGSEVNVSLENDVDAEQNSPSRKDKKKKRRCDSENGVTNGAVELNGKKQKKRKLEEDTVDDSTVGEEALDEASTKKFRWDEVIAQVLQKADDNELPLKKLRKKVMAEYNAYSSHQGHEDTEEKLWAKFEKKVKKNKQLKFHKEKVKLVR